MIYNAREREKTRQEVPGTVYNLVHDALRIHRKFIVDRNETLTEEGGQVVYTDPHGARFVVLRLSEEGKWCPGDIAFELYGNPPIVEFSLGPRDVIVSKDGDLIADSPYDNRELDELTQQIEEVSGAVEELLQEPTAA